jgi:hypothetical protein
LLTHLPFVMMIQIFAEQGKPEDHVQRLDLEEEWRW